MECHCVQKESAVTNIGFETIMKLMYIMYIQQLIWLFNIF